MTSVGASSRARARLVAAWAVVLAAGCGDAKRGDDAAARGSVAPSSRPSDVPAGPTAAAPPGPSSREEAPTPPWDGVDLDPPPDEPADPLAAIGARPHVVSTSDDEPVIAANAALFAEHFGGAVPLPLERREAPLGGGRRALLYTSATPGVTPLVVVTDAAGKALWHKDRPLAGTHERWRGLTITAGPDGSVLVFWWDVTSGAVAGRRWQHDGSVFADFHFFDLDDCTGVDALHWPGRGWVVTAVGGRRALSALLRENGFRGFDDRVIDVGGTHDVLAPVAAAAGIDGVFHAYVGRERGAGPAAPGGDAHLWIMLRREDGSRAWPRPVDLGVVSAGAGGSWPAPRVELLTRAQVRVTIDGRSRDVSSDGKVTAVAGPR